MKKTTSYIHLEEGYSSAFVDMLCETVDGADYYYFDNYIKFRGSESELNDFKNALQRLTKIKKIVTI